MTYSELCQTSTEPVVRRCPVEKVFLKISQNSQENTCARASFSIKLQAASASKMKICENILRKYLMTFMPLTVSAKRSILDV